MDPATNELLRQAATSFVRHALTTACGFLVAQGITLDPAQQASWTEVNVGIVMGLIGLGWAWWQKKGASKLKQEVETARQIMTGAQEKKLDKLVNDPPATKQ